MKCVPYALPVRRKPRPYAVACQRVILGSFTRFVRNQYGSIVADIAAGHLYGGLFSDCSDCQGERDVVAGEERIFAHVEVRALDRDGCIGDAGITLRDGMRRAFETGDGKRHPDLVAKARVPDYALGAHTASLGLAFYTANLLPQRYKNGVFIGQHGSWNRQPRSGYKVIFVAFENGQPVGVPEDVLTGFVDQNGDALGRPVGVAVDAMGALLVADDVGNVIWRVAPDKAQ